MRALAYHVVIPGMENHAAIVGAWRELTEAAGYRVTVCNHVEAHNDRFGPALIRKVSTFPTVNHPTYEEACYLRWIAFARALRWEEIGLITDYDVLIRAKPHELGTTPCVFDAAPVCSAVLLSGKQCRAFADYILTRPDKYQATTVNGAPHTSDMYLFQQWAKEVGLPRHPTIEQKSPAESGWEGARLIHFATDANWRTFGHNNKAELMRSVARRLS